MAMLIVGILFFIFGILSYRLYQARLIRFFPERSELKIDAFLSELSSGNGRIQLVITIENKSSKPVHLEAWFFRVLNHRGFLRQLFHSPQNLVHTVGPHEKISIDVKNIDFLREQTLYTIVIRDIYGREWALEESHIQHLRKDIFWQTLP